MKKLICILLVAIMLIPVIPVMAVGDTTANASNAYFKVGNNYYSTLKGALADAPSASDKTIYLLKNATISEKSLTVPASAEITLNFGGHTLNVNNAGAYLIGNMSGKLTVKNGTINLIKGMVVQNNGHLIIDNMSYNITETGSDARPAVKLSGKGNTKLTVKNSYLKTVGPGEALILVEGATDGTINLVGKTTLEYAGVLDSSIQNCGAIAIQQAYGTNVDSKSDDANTDLVLNVGAEAKIINSAPAIDSEYVASAIVMQTRGDVTLNLAKGATVEIDRAAGKSKSYHIGSTGHDAKLTVNDRGANWAVSARTLREGGIYLSNVCSNDEMVIGWTDGEKIIKNGEVYSDENATKTVNLKPLSFRKQYFDVLDGAAIRKVQDERAIRFTTVVSNKIINGLGDNVTFGALIAEGSSNPSRTPKKVYEFDDVTLIPYDDGRSAYYAALYFDEGLTDSEIYRKTVCSTSYMTVKYYDGSEETFYTEFNYNNVRSIKQVAGNLDMVGYSNNVVDHILDVIATDNMPDEKQDSILIGYCSVNNLYDGPFNSEVGWGGGALGNIIRTSDGKLIVIDGGIAKDAYGFYSLLKEFFYGDTVVVDYWIFTHPHSDHVGTFFEMAATQGIMENLEIKNLVFHFPVDINDGGESARADAKIRNIAEQYHSNIINPYKDQILTIGEAKVQFLYVCENYENYTTANQTSLIFTVELNKKIMFTGDVYTPGLTETYNEYGSSLKSDILQMPHHFLCDTGYLPFYEAVDASVVLLPTCKAGYYAMYNDPSYKNSAKHKANDWAAQNADEVYKAFEGHYEIII